MKFIHLLPVLGVAAALGVLQQSSGSWFSSGSAQAGAYAGNGSPARSPVTPPWLRDDGDEEAADGDENVATAVAPELDPHTDVCNGPAMLDEDGADPHAALCAQGGDPHAGMYDDADDPHAGMQGDDPHAGMYDPAGTAEPPSIETGSVPAPTAPVARSSAPNGKNIAEVFAQRAALANVTLRVRGVVVKLTEGVLGKNYLHLQDGSGSEDAGDNDLTVTSGESFQLGETVEVEGTLAIDQDVGVGYSYPALLASATRVAR